MITKRYGSKVQSVTPNFDARAMNEIGFQRGDKTQSLAEIGKVSPEVLSEIEKVLVAKEADLMAI